MPLGLTRIELTRTRITREQSPETSLIVECFRSILSNGGVCTSTGEARCSAFRLPVIIPTADAELALGDDDLQAADCCVPRDHGLAKVWRSRLSVLSPRPDVFRVSRIVATASSKIEIGLGDPRLPESTFTADQMRQVGGLRTRLGTIRRQGRRQPGASMSKVERQRASSPGQRSGAYRRRDGPSLWRARRDKAATFSMMGYQAQWHHHAQHLLD